MQRLLIVSAVALVADTAFAQNFMGIFANTGTTFTSRGTIANTNANPTNIWNKIDMESYAGWTTGAVPGTRDINGLHFLIQDQLGNTQDPWAMTVYGEDPANPEFPLVGAPIAVSGAFLLPVGPASPVAFNATANFAAPIVAPAGGDVFVAISPGTTVPVWPTDGISIHAIARGVAAANDTPGPAIPAAPAQLAGFGGAYVPVPLSGPTYSAARQFKIEPILPISGGVATAVTNQANHPESGALGVPPGSGTSCMFSGLSPDARNPSLNAGRVDDVGQLYVNAALPPGSPVFFLQDIGAFGPEIPVAVFLPGSTGVACLKLASMATVAIVLHGAPVAGQSNNVTLIPAPARLIIAGLPLLQQAAGLDPVTLTAHAGPCTRQIL